MIYALLFVVLLVVELFYFKIADTYNIIDKPNSRSSHSKITLRGGGVIFPIAVLLSWFLGYVSIAVTMAILLVAIVSFIDDIKPLSQLPRILVQTLAVVLVFWDLGMFQDMIWFFPVVFVFLVGWVNCFNFMDGINGITVLYALVTIASFACLKTNQPNLELLITMMLSCVVFGIFNVRKSAKAFAGDVGSISMAIFLGYFMLKTIVETNQLGYILFFLVYSTDSVLSIVQRISKKENIFEPHRSHLYQYLVNELKYPHVVVASGYAILQLLINALLIFLDSRGMLSLTVVFIIIGISATSYFVIKKSVQKTIALKQLQ